MTKILDGQSFGTIESVKAAEDLYAPLSGEVVEINPAISKDPSIVNKDAFGAWMIKVKNINLSEADSLMDSNKYKDFTASL